MSFDPRESKFPSSSLSQIIEQIPPFLVRVFLGLFGMRALRTTFLLVIVVMMMLMMVMVMVLPMLHQGVRFRLILMTDQKVQGVFRYGGECLLGRRDWRNRRRDRRLDRKRYAM